MNESYFGKRIMRACVLMIVVLCGVAVEAETADLMKVMTRDGIALVDGQRVVLASPSLTAETDAQQRQAVLDRLAGGRGWKHFSRNSVSAPVAIKVQYIKNADGERIGHQVHTAFVVHAPFETLKDADLMEQLLLTPSDSDEASENVTASQLDAKELQAAGVDEDSKNTHYGLVEMPLLNRVLVRGVMRSEQMIADDSITLVWEIDPRFTGDASSRNTWTPVTKNDAGEFEEGEKYPYRGAGGYLYVAGLTELPNACLVEMRFVLHEPTDWFRGSTMLRSKLPLLLQQGARKFRRKVVVP